MGAPSLDISGVTLIPAGYKIGDDFSVYQNAPISVPGGAGYLGAVPTTLVTRYIPPNARAFIKALYLRIVPDVAKDQITFALIRNGIPIYPWDAIGGESTTLAQFVTVNLAFHAGDLAIIALNKTGTGLTGAAADSLAINCQVYWIGHLLIPIVKGTIVL